MIIIPYHPSRDFLSTHPYIFVFGSSVHNPKPFGQARNALGLPNCFGIPTRWSYCRSNGYFSDGSFIDIKIEIDVAISKIPVDDGRPIIVFRKIGEGNSRMLEFAPKSHKYLLEQLDKIKSKDIQWS